MRAHPLNRLTTAEKRPNHVGGKDLMQACRIQLLGATLLKQNPGVVHQQRQRFGLLVELRKHRHHLGFITDICLNSKGFTALLPDLRHHLLSFRFALTVVHRNPITPDGQ